MINKNLCLYYWLKKRIGRARAFKFANKVEKIILIFGRDLIPYTIDEAKDITTVSPEMNDELKHGGLESGFSKRRPEAN